MFSINVIGIDLGKSTFHLIGHDQIGHEQLRKKSNRTELIKFISNHQTKLTPPQYVKPYVKINKNDFIDADAIAEASTRPSMRFVSVKSEDAQVLAVIQRICSGYIKERTACMNRTGSILLEFGLSFPREYSHMKKLFDWLSQQSNKIPKSPLQALIEIHQYYVLLNEWIKQQEKKLLNIVKQDERAQLLKTIPGIGDLVASQCISTISNVQDFKNGQHMAAWIGLVPHQYSTGGKTKLLDISK